MKRPSEDGENWDALRDRIIGLGEDSLRKSYYPELRKRLAELERFRALLDRSNDAILVIELPAGQVVDANLTACQLLGHDPARLKQLKLSELLEVSDDRDIPAFSGDERQGELICGELHTAAGGSIPVELGLHLERFDQKTYAIAVARDIRERMNAESEMRRLEQQLNQAQKMESIGRLAGGIAHDFNNILSVILGYTEISLMKCEDNELRKPLSEISNASGRARDLTRQLLAFSRKQVLELQPMDINEVILGFEKMLGRLIGEDIEVRTNLEPALKLVSADTTQIEQIILNLAVNARDAMQGGGRLTIETRNVALDDAYARLHTTVQPGDYVMLAISDTGCGMDGDTQAHIFEPFFTTKERGKGTGLGLSTVYGIVKQHGGNIWVYSEKGLGTTFKIYLPCVRQEAVMASGQTPIQERLGGRVKVLLVEDDAKLIEVASKMLENLGCEVIIARDSQDAVKLAREDPMIDILLSDVIMPDFSGRQVYEHIASFRPDLKVLYMSGYTDDVIAQHGVLAPGIHFLQKPFTSRELLNKLRETLAG